QLIFFPPCYDGIFQNQSSNIYALHLQCIVISVISLVLCDAHVFDAEFVIFCEKYFQEICCQFSNLSVIAVIAELGTLSIMALQSSLPLPRNFLNFLHG